MPLDELPFLNPYALDQSLLEAGDPGNNLQLVGPFEDPNLKKTPFPLHLAEGTDRLFVLAEHDLGLIGFLAVNEQLDLDPTRVLEDYRHLNRLAAFNGNTFNHESLFWVAHVSALNCIETRTGSRLEPSQGNSKLLHDPVFADNPGRNPVRR